jgi:2-polyprenyl-6-hydroxyphenyl methylase/3-demethylubiquinone-9 3-methyltransferase
MSPVDNPSSSQDYKEIEQFDKLAAQWWDEDGPFKPLHQLNPARLQFICQNLTHHFGKGVKRDVAGGTALPLKDISIVDIGCGGGLVAEPLSRLGASVTGIDASVHTIQVATAHARQMNLPVTYICTSAENLCSTGATFDVVIALEIVEHVANVQDFFQSCTQLVAPGGVLIVSTLNRTWQSYAVAIAGAEYVLRILPRGTHNWHKFLSPAEIAHSLRELNFSFVNLQGLSYSIFKQEWSLSNKLNVNYIGCAKRV